ncbi:MAG: MFS transporter [Bacteroidota bacterium]|nr:MFS transporter [Bacteroidota bacterium]
MAASQNSLTSSRISISFFFFSYGFIFATWASRIPAIQQQLHLSDPQLGTVLLSMPVGSFLALPFSGYLASRHGSRIVVIGAALCYALLLITIGNSAGRWMLAVCLFLFGAASNMLNIAINTQVIELEKRMGRVIISSFHGIWSVAGLLAAAAGSVFIARSVSVSRHFLEIGVPSFLLSLIASTFLVRDMPRARERRSVFTIPEKSMMGLGLIAFSSLICQGAMFDWSGVYFRKVIQADKDHIGLGYTTFMISMTAVRFITDWLHHKLGFKKLLVICGILATSGLVLVCALPHLWTATLGLFLVGLGVSPAVPLVFSAAGKSKTMPPAVAIAAVSSIGMIGLMIGPPLIGFVAGLTSLRISFLILSFFGAAIAIFSLLSAPSD